jgi:hypothetical protein
MLSFVQRFGKHYSCHLQGEYVFVGRFWLPYVWGGGGDRADCLSGRAGCYPARCLRLPKMAIQCIVTLGMTTVVSPKCWITQYSTRLIPKSRTFTFHSSPENLRTRIYYKAYIIYSYLERWTVPSQLPGWKSFPVTEVTFSSDPRFNILRGFRMLL